ncbi:EAL domain-containing protein [Alicyclobacillus tolerans]|uniref:EAL domain-containing protein n=1 Tax=Alicyclobacillus tolerans TaxID=90970 RepID=UPI003B7BBCE3
MLDNCPLCMGTVKGYMIEVDRPSVLQEVIQSLSQHSQKEWQPVNHSQLWVGNRLFFDCLSFWSEYYSLENWDFYEAVKLGSEIEKMNHVTFHEVVARRPVLWVDEIIQRDQIHMMYQPIVHVQHKQTIGYEMLARALKPDGSLISPALLFESARNQSELFRLDRTCRIKGIQAGQQLSQEQLIFVNFIPTSIYIPEHCLQTTMKAAYENGIDNSRIVFEVVETERVDNLEHLKRILLYYRREGFRYALDDVGEGFNDLSTLLALEPDVVKLDRKFVKNIHLDKEKRDRAEKIYRLTSSMNAIALAEGIESAEEARILREIGYDWQQGYYYGKPSFSPSSNSEVFL